MKKTDLTGRVYKFLTVIKYHEHRSGKHHWWCKCVCGKIISAHIANLNRGQESCGCKHIERFKKMVTTHGASLDPIKMSVYNRWHGIKHRCYDTENAAYKRYGGRGITMSDEWKDSFETFFNDMGLPPTIKHQIERRENDLGYCKENCYWATIKEQSINKHWSIYIEYKGERMPLIKVAEVTGIKYITLLGRHWRGEDLSNIESVRHRSIIKIPLELVKQKLDSGMSAYEISKELGVRQSIIEYRKKLINKGKQLSTRKYD